MLIRFKRYSGPGGGTRRLHQKEIRVDKVSVGATNEPPSPENREVNV